MIMATQPTTGPLVGIRVVELAGIGPGPHACMLLADLGAEVIRVEPIGGRSGDPQDDILCRNRKNIVVNLKSPEGVAAVLKLVATADVLIEGFRPGVMERIGLGPDVCLAKNPRLVYGRMTGWGQEGPLAQAAGHDINYISITGALHAIGKRGGTPVPPLNLVGDFGGGSMFLAFGVVCGVLEARKSGKGQVVDAAMVDGSATLMAMFYGQAARGLMTEKRGTNLLDGGAYFYDVYETKDHKHVSIGSIERKFYKLLLKLGGMEDEAELAPSQQFSVDEWESKKIIVARVFRTKTQAEWCQIMEGSDVCFAPVLSMWEAPDHPHAVARKSFVTINDVVQPSPAPRFSRTPSSTPTLSPELGENTNEVLLSLGYTQAQIKQMDANGFVGLAKL
eukprot:m.143568 g.143568  ORF g.143568 m.143568 type:complete len:392 (-) comp30323_c0_seq1:79-1254(-)